MWSWTNFAIGVGVAAAVVGPAVLIVGTGGLATPFVIGIAAVGIAGSGIYAGAGEEKGRKGVGSR